MNEEQLLEDIRKIMVKYGYQCRDMADEIVQAAIASQSKNVLPNQEPLGSEFEKVLYENLDSLYETDVAPQAKSVPIGYIDREQLTRWEKLRGTEFECAERAYIGFSTKPFKTEMTDCTLAVYAAPQPPDERVRELAAKYNELIMAVASKFPNETRHETALRYIKNAEAPAIASMSDKGGE